MDYFAQELGYTIINFAIAIAMLWLIFRSGALITIGKILLLVLAGVILIGIPTVVIFNVHLPNESYIQAFFVAIIGYGMAVPWFIWDAHPGFA